MSRSILWLTCCALLSLSGCDSINLLQLLSPKTVTVALVNNGSFPIDVKVMLSNSDQLPDFLIGDLLANTEELDFVVPAGERVTFSRFCSDIQSVEIKDADLRVVGGIGPETNSNVLRDNEDFSCGDLIEFRFSHSDLVVDFDVSISINPAGQ